MQVHVVGKQIDRNGVIHGNPHNLLTRLDLYVFSFCRNSQVLHYFEDIFAYLLFRIVVHHRKTRLFLDFVRQLVFRRVGRNDLYRRVNRKGENCGNQDGLYFARPPLATPAAQAHFPWRTPITALLPANRRASNLHTSKLASPQTSV
jgi:hypothetical protein